MQRIVARVFVLCSPDESTVERTAAAIMRRVPDSRNIRTWTERLGRSKLRSFTDAEGHFWLEQNPAKASKWATLARQGHQLAWEFAGPGGAYTGRMLIDGEIYTPSEAMKKFLP
jgi:hypothetical protein